MKLIQKNEIKLKDFFEREKTYAINIVYKDSLNIFPGDKTVDVLITEDGYSFSVVDDERVVIYLDYAKISPGLCALVSYLISTSEIKDLTNAMWMEYGKCLDHEITKGLNLNMSEAFFNQLTYKNTKK